MILKNNGIKSYDFAHDVNGDNMKDLLWQLFIHTGKIEYYIRYKEEVRKDGSGEGYYSRKDL